MMKQLATFLCTAALALASIATAQTVRTDLFDLKKSQQELEVMRGILSTTLGFVVRELRGRNDRAHAEAELLHGLSSGSIAAYYLYGQGAVFNIPSSSMRSLWGDRLGGDFRLYADMSSTFGALAEAERAVEGLAPVAGGVPGGVVGGVVGGVPGGVEGVVGVPERRRPATQAAQPPQPNPNPNPDRQSARRQEEMRKRLEDLQEKVKERRAETEKRRAKMQEHLVEVRSYLIEALANHGDSLTHVKPAEYVTLILATDEGEPHFPGETTRVKREIISVPKSVITDYKAGRINLEAFKQKVLTYSN